MTRLLHLANTDAEQEMAGETATTLEDGLNSTQIIRQLQFLPLLYKRPYDGICTTAQPEEINSLIHSIHDQLLPYEEVVSWAPSLKIAQWAKSKGLMYKMPDWKVVQQINSKAFSFELSPKLPTSELIYSFDQLMHWMRLTTGTRVLKTCFGMAGKGHLLLPCSLKKIEAFAGKEFLANRPIIAEPWVQRVLDFSTQWIITPSGRIHYEGATVMKNTAKGRYQSSYAGEEKKLFHTYHSLLVEHQVIAKPILHHIASQGFFGHIGIDAMVMQGDKLHPIVEINGRKTMGWVCLQIAKKFLAHQVIEVTYQPILENKSPLLPENSMFNGKKECFSYNLYANITIP